MSYTKNFKELSKKDADIAGGKGASLGEMTQVGIPVPPGFVVLADTFEQFLHSTDLLQEIDAILETVDHKEIHTVESASEKIQGLIKNAQTPENIKTDILKDFDELNTEFVAVRSSATAEDGQDHAWAGQLDSYLNITKEHVLEKVQHCWSSLFTPRAIFYRFEKQLDTTKISVAVVVQKMVNSEVSGIAFSVHPVTEDRNQLIIEAGFGLGEAIVSGSITPDSYVVEKEPRSIIDINVSTQNRALYRSDVTSIEHGNNEWRGIDEPKASSQVLIKDQILELSEIIIGIEKHYGFPCDIEWAFEEEKFYIVQSRPITTLSIVVDKKEKKRVEKILSRDLPLIDIYVWFIGYSESMQKYLDWSYSDTLFYRCVDHVETYRPIGEYPNQLMNAFEIKNRKEGWFDNLCATYKIDTQNAFDFFERNDDISEYSNEKILDIYKEYIEIIKRVMAPFVIFYTIPNWFEQEVKSNSDVLKMSDISMRLRKESEMIFPKGAELVDKILHKVNEGLNFEEKLLKFISYDEITNYLENRDLINEEKLEERSNGVILSKDGLTLISDKGFSKVIESLGYYFIEDEANGDCVKGQPAFMGKIKGIVQIILSKDSLKDFKEGNILVTGMTTPEYLPTMQKAVAFVTDEGGITCHAAIVAREFKKPCIIGTKSATKVLKDGDMVEVDADNGIVRIIK